MGQIHEKYMGQKSCDPVFKNDEKQGRIIREK